MQREYNYCTSEIHCCNVSEVSNKTVRIKKDGMFKGNSILQEQYAKTQCYVNVIPDILFT